MLTLSSPYWWCAYLMMVGMISAVKRMQRWAAAWEENSPITENTVMADSDRSAGQHRWDCNS